MSSKTPARGKARADSQASRQAMLQATLKIILSDGIRAVKFQNVADVSGLSVSSIAYHYTDMPTLIEAAFQFHLQQHRAVMGDTRELTPALQAGLADIDSGKPGAREAFVELYLEWLMAIVSPEYREVDEHLRLDRLFRNEMRQLPGLRRALQHEDEKDLQAVIALMRQLGTDDPEADAVQLLALLWMFAEQLLHQRENPAAKAYAAEMIGRCVRRLLR